MIFLDFQKDFFGFLKFSFWIFKKTFLEIFKKFFLDFQNVFFWIIKKFFFGFLKSFFLDLVFRSVPEYSLTPKLFGSKKILF